MNKLIFTFLLLCISTTANAQLTDAFKEFVKVYDPNTLEYYYFHNSDCPWTEGEAKDLIEGVIKRSRIKTQLGTGGSNNLYLNVDPRCVTSGSVSRDTGWAVNFEVMYGDYPVLFEKRYGNLAVGGLDDKQFFLNSLKSFVETAVTDFVEVNFLNN